MFGARQGLLCEWVDEDVVMKPVLLFAMLAMLLGQHREDEHPRHLGGLRQNGRAERLREPRPDAHGEVAACGSDVSGTSGTFDGGSFAGQDVTIPNYTIINNIGLTSGLSTVQLVACTPPHSVTFRHVTTARLVSVT